MKYTAGELASIIKKSCEMDIDDLGDETEQATYIYHWMNMFLFQNAKKLRVTATSDPLSISTSDDYVTFKKGSNDIDDLYEPYQLLDTNDKQVAKRTSYDSTNVGWFREDSYTPIHVRGLNGTYRLKYIKYASKITSESDYPELPPAAYHEMITWICAQIRLVKNYYNESQALLGMSNSVKLAAVKAAEHGMGTNAQKPGPDDANLG